MPNDVSYFKIPGDTTTYQFNDPDAESRIGTLETTVDSHDSSIQSNTTAIGTLSSLSTSAKSNLVAAINEVDSHADTNASGITTLNNTAFLRLGALASGSTDDVFVNGVYSLSSSNTYTGLPTGVTAGALVSFKPLGSSNYYTVHLCFSASGYVYSQIYTSAWSAWKQLNN